VISLKVPGSFVDENIKTGKVGRFQRGSGTSQSTAVVSGLAALLFSKYPTATPDQIKSFMRTSALPLKIGLTDKGWFTGAGEASVAKAVTTATLPDAPKAAILSSGLGSLEATRGTSHVGANGILLTGEIDIFGQPWTPATTALDWDGGTWNNTMWTGDSWDGARWTGARWTGARWTAGVWDGARWTSMNWDGARWTGARWTGARWTAGAWDGARWSGADFSDDGWD
jgi:serine protease AprX